MITDSLIAYYKLDGNSNDSVGSFNGSDTAITYNAGNGKVNSGAGFDGSTSKVTIADNATLRITGALSISAWVKIADLSTSRVVVNKGTDDIADWEYEFRVNANGAIAFLSGKGGVNFYELHTVATGLVTLNTWHHIVVTKEGSGSGSAVKLYVDGVEQTTSPGSSNPSSVATSTNPVEIGVASAASNQQWMNGAIDEVAIWGRELGLGEVEGLYNTGLANQYPFGLLESLISYWKLDESSGNAEDYIGPNDLTNNGSTPFVAGKVNNGADLEAGSSQDFSISHGSQVGLNISSDLSIALWLKVESAPASGDKRTIFSKWNEVDAGMNQRSYQFYYKNDGGTKKLFFEVSNDGVAEGVFSANVDLSTGVFRHVAVTWDASTSMAEIYVDGASIGSGATGSVTSIFNSTATVNVGETSAEGTTFWDGVFDEIGIWGRTLTSGEIAILYNSGIGVPFPFSFITTIYAMTATVRAYILNGMNIGFIRPLMASVGAFVLNGPYVSLLKVPTLLVADLVEYVINGIDVTLTKANHTPIIYPAVSQYVLNGIDAVLRKKGWRNRTRNNATWTDRTKNTAGWINRDKSN